MCIQDWTAARDLLSQRLERCTVLGYRRTTLFLLSIAATSSGYDEIGQQLWQQAKESEAQFDEPRSLVLPLETPNDPQSQEIMSGLQTAWQQFNGWGRQSSPQISETNPSNLEDADWARFSLLLEHSQATNLEQEFGTLLNPPTPPCRWLWNLVALCHLDSGDLRSYQEMCEAAPQTNEVPLPEALLKALQESSLRGLLPELQSGSWITAGLQTLQNFEPDQTQESSSSEAGEQSSWGESFRLALNTLRLQSHGEAARHFQRLADQAEAEPQAAYALNALTVALFAQGLYIEAEEVNSELTLLLQKDLQLTDQPWSSDFRSTLEDLGYSPPTDSDLINPFSAQQSEQVKELVDLSESVTENTQGFWGTLAEALQLLESHDQEVFRRALMKLSRELSPQKSTHHAILVFLLARSCLSEGDQFGGQEFSQDLQTQFAEEKIDLQVAREAADCFLAAGQPDLARLFQNLPNAEIPTALNPWQDLSAAS